MSKKAAQKIIASFLYNHIQAGNFWRDDSYIEEIAALAKLGYQRAIQALEYLKQA